MGKDSDENEKDIPGVLVGSCCLDPSGRCVWRGTMTSERSE
jgi:hypothetical protein